MKKRVIASIHLKSTEEGGRKGPILPIRPYGCPVCFESIDTLSDSYWDCRVLMEEYGRQIFPGEKADEIALIFLSEDIVLPHLRPGVKFFLWEGKLIGEGTVLRIEDKKVS